MSVVTLFFLLIGDWDNYCGAFHSAHTCSCLQALTHSTRGEAKAARMPVNWRLQQKRKALEVGYLQEVYASHNKAWQYAKK